MYNRDNLSNQSNSLVEYVYPLGSEDKMIVFGLQIQPFIARPVLLGPSNQYLSET